VKTTLVVVKRLFAGRTRAAYHQESDRLRLAMDSATLRAMAWNRSQPSSLWRHETRKGVVTWKSAVSLAAPFGIEGQRYGRREDPTE
jgi:hypothetical protein